MSGYDIPRHFTATGFVVHRDATLLHWHRRVQAWLPPGGHVEENEDPVQAVLREVKEETGLEVRIVPAQALPEISTLAQLHPPRTILVEDVWDESVGAHQHIDLIYFTAVNNGADELDDGGHPTVPEGWLWIERSDLESGMRLKNLNGETHAPPEDVRSLGLMAIRGTDIEIDSALA